MSANDAKARRWGSDSSSYNAQQCTRRRGCDAAVVLNQFPAQVPGATWRHGAAWAPLTMAHCDISRPSRKEKPELVTPVVRPSPIHCASLP